MGIESIASQLYTISSKKKVPLKTAFSIMVKEEMAARFSVYNLVKTATKSSLLAMLAHRAYGKETPEQQREREENEKKDDIEKKFKKFTVNSLVNLNNKVNLLSAVTQRNSALIMQLYNDLGYYKNQKRFNPNNAEPIMRVPLRDKTIKGKLDELNEEIEKLKAAGSKLESAKKGAKDKKKPEKKDDAAVPAPDAGKLGMLAQFAADNPRLAAVLEPVLAALGLTGGVAAVGAAGGAVTGTGAAAGAARALGGAASLTRLGVAAGGLVASGAVLSQLPKAVSDTATRFEGGSVGKDKYSENINRMYTNVMLPAGAYVATTGAISIYERLRERQLKKQFDLPPAQQTRINKYLKQLEALEKKLVAKGMPADDARKAVQAAIDKIAKFGIGDAARLNLPPLDSKWFKFAKASKGILKRLPGANAALVAYEISKMSGYYADRHTGAMSAEDYKKNMSRGYASIAETVGTTVMGALIGAAAGTMFAGPLGTAVGALGGIAVGGITSLFIDDEKGFMNDAGVKIFEMIHEDKKPAPAPPPPSKPAEEKAEQRSQARAQTQVSAPPAAPPPEQAAAPAPPSTPAATTAPAAAATPTETSPEVTPEVTPQINVQPSIAVYTPSPLLANLSPSDQTLARNWAWSMYIGQNTMDDVPEKFKQVSGDILSQHLPPNWYAERERYKATTGGSSGKIDRTRPPQVVTPAVTQTPAQAVRPAPAKPVAKPSAPVTVAPDSTLIDIKLPTLPMAEEIAAFPKPGKSPTRQQVSSLTTAISKEQIKDIIIDAADRVGIDAGIMLAMGKQESGFDPNAGAATSSAKGLFQFLKGTWKDIVSKYGNQYPELARGRLDPEANAIAGALFIKQNAEVLSKADIPITGANIYAAHFLGAYGAKKLLSAGDNSLADAILPFAAKSNPYVFYKKKGKKIDTSQPRTVGEIKEFLFHVTASAESYSDRVKQRREKRGTAASTASTATTSTPAEEKQDASTAPESGMPTATQTTSTPTSVAVVSTPEPIITKTRADKEYETTLGTLQKLLSDGKITQKEFEKQVTALDASRKKTNKYYASQRQVGPETNQASTDFLKKKFPGAKKGNRYWVNGVRYAYTPYSVDITGTGKGKRDVWYIDYDANNPNRNRTQINPEGAKLLAQQKWTGPDKTVSDIKLIVEAEKAQTETRQAQKYRREKAEAAGVSMPPEETATPTESITQTVSTPTTPAEETDRASRIFYGSKDWAYMVYTRRSTLAEVPVSYKTEIDKYLANPPVEWMIEAKEKGIEIPQAHNDKLMQIASQTVVASVSELETSIDAVDAASVAQTLPAVTQTPASSTTSVPLGALGVSTANPAQAVAESLGLTDEQKANAETSWAMQIMGIPAVTVQAPTTTESAPTATPVVMSPPAVASTPNQVVELPPKIEEPVVAMTEDDGKPDPMDAIAAQSSATMGAMTTIVGAIRQLSEKVATMENSMPKTEFPKVLNQEPSIAAYADSMSKQFELKGAILQTVS